MFRVLSLFFNLFEPLFRLGQRFLGFHRLGWLFVGPNLLVFGVFTFLPILINFIYAGTGGVKLMPFERPFTASSYGAFLWGRFARLYPLSTRSWLETFVTEKQGSPAMSKTIVEILGLVPLDSSDASYRELLDKKRAILSRTFENGLPSTPEAGDWFNSRPSLTK